MKGSTRICHGTLVNVSADNPAACLIGGFKQLHSAFRKCRHCMATDEDIQSKVIKQYKLVLNIQSFQFNETQFQLRTRQLHSHHLQNLDGPLASEESIISGVVRESILNTSKYFHVVDGLAPDIMHDLLEGVLHLVTSLLLKEYIINQKILSLDTLNRRIDSFCYGPSESSNKPTPLKQTQHEISIKLSGISFTYIFTIKVFITIFDVCFFQLHKPGVW